MLSDSSRVRTIASWVAVGIAAESLGVAFFFGSPNGAALVVAVGAAFLSFSAWQLPRWREYLLAVAAGLTVMFIPDAGLTVPAGAALIYLAVVHDRHQVPWSALIAGAVGAIYSLIMFSYKASVWPFVAVLLGASLGLLARSIDRSNALTHEAGLLRERTRSSEDQAKWLEQRTSLARELHDVVGHHVTAMVVQAEAGQVSKPHAALRSIGDLGRTALGELDALVVHLRDPDSPLTMTAPPRLTDVDEVLAAPLRQHGVDVLVRLEPDLGLDEVGELTAYRIIQESLTNITRHAGARNAWVEVARSGQHVRLRVSDDGVGPPAISTRGSGLVGIGERVKVLGGMWAISERPGGGTIVDVFLPPKTNDDQR